MAEGEQILSPGNEGPAVSHPTTESSPAPLSKFSEKLAGYVQAAGVKQTSLAEAVGMNPLKLNRWLHGKRIPKHGPALNTVLALGAALRLNIPETGQLLETAGYNPHEALEMMGQLPETDKLRLRKIRAKAGPATVLAGSKPLSKLNITPLIDPTFPGDFSQRLSTFIEINATTQRKLAHKIGMDNTLLNKIIKGARKPSFELINRFATSLGLSDQDRLSLCRLFLTPKLKDDLRALQAQSKQQK